MDFEAGTVELSMRNAETGKALTASVYNVTFDDGSGRVMSIGQLVMALCLQRATTQEASVVSMMDEMAETTNWIEALTSVEQKILDKVGDSTSATVNLRTDITGSWTIKNTDDETKTYTNAYELLSAMGIELTNYSMLSDTVISKIESKLDQCNTTSQEQMISLQSATNKRDQSYEMISNVLKSLYTVMSGIVSNA